MTQPGLLTLQVVWGNAPILRSIVQVRWLWARQLAPPTGLILERVQALFIVNRGTALVLAQEALGATGGGSRSGA